MSGEPRAISDQEAIEWLDIEEWMSLEWGDLSDRDSGFLMSACKMLYDTNSLCAADLNRIKTLMRSRDNMSEQQEKQDKRDYGQGRKDAAEGCSLPAHEIAIDPKRQSNWLTGWQDFKDERLPRM